MVPKLYFSFLDTPASVSGFFNALIPPLWSALLMICGLLAVRLLAPGDGAMESFALSAGVGGAVYFGSMWLQPVGRVELMSLVADVRSALRIRRG
jgi:hypothetical protein